MRQMAQQQTTTTINLPGYHTSRVSGSHIHTHKHKTRSSLSHTHSPHVYACTRTSVVKATRGRISSSKLDPWILFSGRELESRRECERGDRWMWMCGRKELQCRRQKGSRMHAKQKQKGTDNFGASTARAKSEGQMEWVGDEGEKECEFVRTIICFVDVDRTTHAHTPWPHELFILLEHTRRHKEERFFLLHTCGRRNNVGAGDVALFNGGRSLKRGRSLPRLRRREANDERRRRSSFTFGHHFYYFLATRSIPGNGSSSDSSSSFSFALLCRDVWLGKGWSGFQPLLRLLHLRTKHLQQISILNLSKV